MIRRLTGNALLFILVASKEGGRNVDSKVFGQFVAKIRKERGMTQAELGELIGVTDKAISRVGERNRFPGY